MIQFNYISIGTVVEGLPTNKEVLGSTLSFLFLHTVLGSLALNTMSRMHFVIPKYQGFNSTASLEGRDEASPLALLSPPSTYLHLARPPMS